MDNFMNLYEFIFSVLNIYYWIVLYSSYKEIQEMENYEEIIDTPASQPASSTNNTVNLNIDKCIIIAPSSNRAGSFQNIP